MSKSYEQQLIEDWEDIFRQGLLTFWVFVAIEQKALSVGEIKQEVSALTKGTYEAADQTIYRLLRKQHQLETVTYIEVSSKNGPNKKVYSLSEMGQQILRSFSKRNISLFQQPQVKNLIERSDHDIN